MQARALPWCLLSLLGLASEIFHWITTFFMNVSMNLITFPSHRGWQKKSDLESLLITSTYWVRSCDLSRPWFFTFPNIYTSICMSALMPMNINRVQGQLSERVEKAEKNQPPHQWSRGPSSSSFSVHHVCRVQWEQSDEMPSNPGPAEPSIIKYGVEAGRAVLVMEDLTFTTIRISIPLLVH